MLLVIVGVFVATHATLSFGGVGEALVGTPTGVSQLPAELLLILLSPAAIALIAFGVALVAGWVGYLIGRHVVVKASS